MKMFGVTFMLFLSFFFAFSGAEYYDFQSRGRTVDTSDNLRPCGVLHQVNSQGTKEYFLERCDLYSMPQNCSEAWELFVGVWNATANYSASNPPDYTAFIEFFDWKAYMQENKYQPIFYSGSGQCPDIVHRLTNVTGIPLITLEDQNGPYAVANAAWCNPQYFNATTGSCAQQTVWGHVPNGNQSSYNQYQGAAFWGPASAHFGKSAFGTVWALLRSFQTPTAQIPAYPNGIFRGEELPMVMKQEAVTGFRVVVVSNTIQPNETCNNPAGTVWQIQTQVKARWNDTKCIVDPPCILQFACDPAEAQLFNTTSLTNKDMKCNYFFALQEELGTAANLNCDCSTDDISMDGDNFVTSSPACPIPHKKSNDSSSPKHPWYSWPNWFIVVCSVGGGLVLVAIVAAVIIKRRKRSGYEEINTNH